MKARRGFSLIELIITISLAAILLSIAVPSYTALVIRANRTTAMEAIMAAAACEERIYSRTGAYSFDDTCKTTPEGYQQLVITNLDSSQGFRVVAVPVGRQAEDQCKSLGLDHTGAETVTDGATKPAAQCWAGR